jgi:hypothetical protein
VLAVVVAVAKARRVLVLVEREEVVAEEMVEMEGQEQ